ncbi:ATP-binding cassette domain-containing protein [Microvirga massiliensis]|uniref:ATP-binding cassette domain-containing protein n=1 Tax=Microvirga massiliensis TaxID=1033741 RepID=UPI00062BAD8A|nr:ATP-binding cassette domain-containing protein [Microvirga massiliensis]
MSEPLALTEVTIVLGDRRLFAPLSFTVAPGEITTVMGPSGSGKSTLLSYLSGFLAAPFNGFGRVAIGEQDITGLAAERRRIGILFQDDLLFPHLSVGQNLAFGLPASAGSRQERRQIIERALAQAGLEGFRKRDPATLSGGQRARVALLRTLLAEPRALLLDEPFNRLDVALRQEIRRFVFERSRERSIPVLLVTHDPEDAAAAGGPIVTLRQTI